MDNTEINLPIYKVPVGLACFLSTLDGGHLQGSMSHNYLVEATNKRRAKLSLMKSPHFWRNYNQLPKEQREKLRPFTLLDEQITEILKCNKRHKNKDGDYTCGIPVHEMPPEKRGLYSPDSTNGEFGMCCIEGYDPFDSDECPYN